ncbi:hypothetical protein Ea357_099 [Erwinia phage Ea35-70]|uniref:Uncharacterized protein n=1 Tax=Erwinia phage Ea35-70 TaxID=1429768 RepID=W6AT59_9CAUD|nr:hypothetical protein Ea357_099 [Erwinia phage Ea35-70]AHI60250.1 hypothetical protein Ea357_099 [Erwinia phage Ea35-70]
MSEQAAVKPKNYTNLTVTIAGNDPVAATAVASVLSTYLNEKGLAGRRLGENAIAPDFAVQSVEGLAADQNNSVNVSVDTLTMESLQGRTQVWDWPTWGDSEQPWTALVGDELRNLWSTFSGVQKRAIYKSLSALNIVVEDDEMTEEKAQDIINNSEVYVDLRDVRNDGSYNRVLIDGAATIEELDAIKFIFQTAREGNPVTHEDITLQQQQDASNGAHAAPELPDGRETPEMPDTLEPLASPEYNPEDLEPGTGIPAVNPTDPSLAPQTKQQAVSFDNSDKATLAAAPTSGTVRPSDDMGD